MSEKLLEQLQIKKKPETKEEVSILFPGQIKITSVKITKSDEDYDPKTFFEKLQIQTKDVCLLDIKEKPKVIEKKPIKKIKKIKKGKFVLKVKDTSTQEKKEIKDKKEKKPKKVETDVELTIPAKSIKILDMTLEDRLPKDTQKIKIKAPSYYMNNRGIFINFINSMLRPYREEILSDKKKITCDMIKNSKNKNFELLLHQMIVRDYMNLYTPYRGLLLYHGLGAGKTCGSIGIAEGLKSDKKIIVMTPASLRMNYKTELLKCGDPLYKINQYWEFIKTNNNAHQIKALSEVLSLPTSYIRKNNGVWLVDVNKKSNFNKLKQTEKIDIEEQINKMIDSKYKFIAYNGINKARVTAMEIEATSYNGTSNPFTNSVVIIDEAHNFVSRIVNKLKKPKSLSMKLYKYLMDADNCRIIFLTGTPIINYPNEIGILFNILRGYIKTYYFPEIKTDKKINDKKIKEILGKYNALDYVEYKVSKKTLVITRNPFEFVSKKSKNTYAGVQYKKNALDSEADFIKKIVFLLKKNGISTNKNRIEIKKHTALPDNLDTFNNLFVNVETGELKNENLFKRRILGLTSYFRSAQESLLPQYNPATDMKILELPMSDYQLKIYELARQSERSENKRNALKKMKNAESGIYGDIASTYRIFSRVFCNFVFPKEIERPMPDKNKKLNDILNEPEKIDEDDLDDKDINERLNNLDGRYTNDDKKDIQDKQVISDTNYKERMQNALEQLKEGTIDPDTNKRTLWLKGEKLKELSPKYHNILSKLDDEEYEGLHLLYSQFRTLEGVGVFKAVLETNGYTQFKIKKSSNGLWILNIPKEEEGKPCFCLYTGEEGAEEKEIIRNIFNSNWNKIPSSLKNELEKISPNNYLGEIIKLIMITSSGAEGITLENVRFVHILEPYWHPVRSEQVIGRAVRICSHKNLEKKYRNVKVFQYIMKITQEQIKGNPNSKDPKKKKPQITTEMLRNDKSKFNPDEIFTTDQSLHEISNRKETINKNILMAIKQSAFDCALHRTPNSKENIQCFSFSTSNRNEFISKPNLEDEEKDSITGINKAKTKWKGVVFSWRGKKMVLKRDNPNDTKSKTGDVYDYESYRNKSLVKVGRLEIDPKKPSSIKFVPI